MKSCKDSLLLYAVTDRDNFGGDTLYYACEKALRGGASMLQLREKETDVKTFLDEAVRLKELCGRFDVPFIINDDVYIAVECDADGAHIGQKDISVKAARRILGEGKLLGVSAQTVEQARQAEADGADYLGVGAMFPTATKGDADAVSTEMLRRIVNAVNIPVCAIGGITLDNMKILANTGICGAAVVSAIFSATEIETACATLKSEATRLFSEDI